MVCGIAGAGVSAGCLAGRNVSGLKAELHRSLQATRQALLSRLEGLREYDLRRPLTPTGTSLLRLVRHLADVEYIYLGASFDRPAPETLPPWDESDKPGDLRQAPRNGGPGPASGLRVPGEGLEVGVPSKSRRPCRWAQTAWPASSPTRYC
jgi:uncharacterized protein DUF664